MNINTILRLKKRFIGLTSDTTYHLITQYMSVKKTYICSKCELSKAESDYYSNGRGGIRLNACKECTKSTSKVMYNTKKLLKKKPRKTSDLDMEIENINETIQGLNISQCTLGELAIIKNHLAIVMERISVLQYNVSTEKTTETQSTNNINYENDLDDEDDIINDLDDIEDFKELSNPITKYEIQSTCKIIDGELHDEHHGYLYIIREREFIKSCESIFKVGHTNKPSPYKRLSQYPNNSEVIAIVKVHDAKNAESAYLETLNSLCIDCVFVHRRDIGREYYEGDVNRLVDILYQVVKGLPS
jgi:hypothetical protein